MAEMWTPRRALLVTAVALAVVVGYTVTADAGAPTAHAAGKCSVSKDGRKLGATYVTSLSVTKVSCSSGKKVVKAYNACRRSHGGAKGRCPRPVRGYHCSETRTSIPTEFSAKVGCKDGRRRVNFKYTQFT
jgi:hypothetical protein